MVQASELLSKVTDLDIDFNRDYSRLTSIDFKVRAIGIVMMRLSMNPLSLAQLAEEFGIPKTREVDAGTHANLQQLKYRNTQDVTRVGNEPYWALAKLLGEMENKGFINIAINNNDPTIGDHVTGDHTYMYYRTDEAKKLEFIGKISPPRKDETFKNLESYVDTSSRARSKLVELFRYLGGTPTKRFY